MEWYWIAAIITAFFVIAGVLIWLGKNGKLTNVSMVTIGRLLDLATTAANVVANSTENAAIDTFALVMTLVDKAANAAQNAYYNAEITADERYNECLKDFNELLHAANIELTEAQLGVISTLIKASCEQMGHCVVKKIEGK